MDQKLLISGFLTQDKINGKSYFGGAAGGMALNMSYFNGTTGLVSIIGSDLFSKHYLSALKVNSINIDLCKVKKGKIPLLTVINGSNSESSRIFNDFGVGKILEKYQPDLKKINQYAYLHCVNTPKMLCDYFADFYTGSISYTPGSFLIRDSKNLSINLLNKSSLVFTNQEEFKILQKLADISSLFKNKLKYLICTNGEKGVTIYMKTISKHYKTPEISNIVDTTGAGDAFAVGFISQYILKKTREKCVKNGLALASLAIQQNGVVLDL